MSITIWIEFHILNRASAGPAILLAIIKFVINDAVKCSNPPIDENTITSVGNEKLFQRAIIPIKT